MTEWSFPFADNKGDRAYSDADFAKFFSVWFANGVFINVGSGLKVSGSINGMNLTLKKGAANINGRVYYLNDDQAFSVPVASNSQDRIDSIVIRLDLASRVINAVYKQSDTTVTRNDNVTELQIAKILVPKSSTVVEESNITDMRSNETVCGLASPTDPIDVGEFTTQYEALFNLQLTQNANDFTTWFKNLKSQLDSNQASNLQNQIDAANEKIDLKANLSDHTRIKSWQPQIDYKAGDLVFVGNVGYRNSGKLTNAVLRCLVDHTSTDVFPDSSEHKWFLINKEAYLISVLTQFGWGRNVNITRNGNNVKFAYLATTGKNNINKGGYALDEKLPVWSNPTHEFSDNDDPAVYVIGFDMNQATSTFGLALHRTDGIKTGFYAYTNIPAGLALRGSVIYITDAEEQWQGGKVS